MIVPPPGTQVGRGQIASWKILLPFADCVRQEARPVTENACASQDLTTPIGMEIRPEGRFRTTPPRLIIRKPGAFGGRAPAAGTWSSPTGKSSAPAFNNAQTQLNCRSKFLLRVPDGDPRHFFQQCTGGTEFSQIRDFRLKHR